MNSEQVVGMKKRGRAIHVNQKAKLAYYDRKEAVLGKVGGTNSLVVEDQNIGLHDQREEKQTTATVRYAGFWMRLWAFLLDMVVLFSINSIIIRPILRINEIGISTVFTFTLETLAVAVSFFLYFAFLTKYVGQTLGKMVFGLRVVSGNEERLTWTQVIFREGIGRLIHQIFFWTKLIYLVVAFSPNKQGIHDMVADTYVIHEKE
ncbi:RDD family protein [Alkalihalobacillus sp. 1P02AB]|uniref:RDD family protein n=1 Tax=Alkalihalobacillus sp. 1P02AB TaxID=3132260 RepID=UPI0039A4C196